MTGRALRVAAVCLLLAVAGCTAPVGDTPIPQAADQETSDEPTTTTTEEIPEYVTVEGDLAVDANRTYRRVETLVDGDYPGTRVVVRNLSRFKSGSFQAIPFFRAFGVTNPSLNASEPAGLTFQTGTVHIYPAEAGPEHVEQVLAHEFAHVAQVREEMVPWFGGLSLGATSLDKRFARRALVEGGAVFVTDAYTRQYQPDLQLQSANIADQYANGSAANRFVFGQYHFGFQYVNATIDDPSQLATVYKNAPETSENLLHPGERDDRVPLDVTVEADAFDRTRSPTRRAGEFVARVVLSQTTNESTAVEASAGWGNDRVLAFDTRSQQSVAWVTRWDTSEDASEFAAAARTLGERAMGPQSDQTYEYRTERVDETTVVVFAGSDDFVETAAASGNVTVAA